MNIQIQRAAVWFLDRCNGCGACMAACKTVWTREPGSEAIWWLRVETGNASGESPAISWPEGGGWMLEGKRLRLKSFRRSSLLTRLFHHPAGKSFAETGEPWSWDAAAALATPLGPRMVQAELRSPISGTPLPLSAAPTPAHPSSAEGVSLVQLQEPGVTGEFSFFLPVLCTQCLNPSCVAACPSGALVKREEDGIVVVEDGRCRGWGSCVPACPYGMVQTNWRDGQARKCHFCFPAGGESGTPFCAASCPTQALVTGWVLYDLDGVAAAAAAPHDQLVEAQRNLLLDPRDPEILRLARRSGIPDRQLEAAQASLVFDLFVRWKLALPLRPDWRTLPMSFYVPPLLPVREAPELGESGHDASLRRMVARLAALFAAGAEHYVWETLQRLQALRAWREGRSGGEPDNLGRAEPLRSPATLPPAELEQILAGLAALFSPEPPAHPVPGQAARPAPARGIPADDAGRAAVSSVPSEEGETADA